MPRDNVIELLGSLVSFDTTSRNSNLNLVDWAVSSLKKAGARIRVTHDDTSTKANILATLGPDDSPGVVLSAHTDVVPVDDQAWSSDPFQLVEREGRLHGRGAVDMKGFIACCLAGVSRWAKASFKRPIHLAFSYDEEVGCFGVPRLIDDLVANYPKPEIAIIGEPSNMMIGDSHRGYAGFHTTFNGRAAHSGDPTQGINAIYAAARFIRRLETTQAETQGKSSTTVSVGRISGGTNINIVAGECEVWWEIRQGVDEDAAFLKSAVENLLQDPATPPELRPVTQEIIMIPSLNRTKENRALAVAQQLGAILAATPLSFGTEAGFFQRKGIPSIVCGPGSIQQAHKPDEWIAIEQLKLASSFLDRVVTWATHDHDKGKLQ